MPPIEMVSGQGTAGRLTQQQWPKLESLFQEVFGQPMGEALMQWKYGSGHGLSIGLFHDGGESDDPPLLAHCGVIFRAVLAAGRLGCAAQITDLMVSPRARGRLSRQRSPFATVVASAMAQSELALPQFERRVYGFPSGRAMKLGEHLGLFREVDHMHQIRWAPSAGPQPEAHTEATPEFVAEVDSLWEAMAEELGQGIIGVRDGRTFSQRYLAHPIHRYSVHLLRSRWLRRPVAALALRLVGDEVELTDWVAPTAALPALLQSARAVAGAMGAKPLVTWTPRRFAPAMAAEAESSYPMEIRILCRGDATVGEFAGQLDRWFLTPGDTDYR